MTEIGLRQLTRCARLGKLPDRLLEPEIREKIAQERRWLVAAIADDKDALVYTYNTRTGHRDNERLSPDQFVQVQYEILESHAVPGPKTCYTDHEVRCIGLAKLIQVSAGGSGLSEPLFLHALQTIANMEFKPNVPKNQTYSSGDVIPAAHWARALINWDGYRLEKGLLPGESLGLINGSFVHIGLAAASFEQAEITCHLLIRAMAAVATLSGARAGSFSRPAVEGTGNSGERWLNYLQEIVGPDKGSRLTTSPQVSVSIRAIPELLLVMDQTLQEMEKEITAALRAPSGNPLYDFQKKEIKSQGSFLAFGVALAQTKWIETLLLVGSALCGQLEYLLSGHVSEIPVDAKTDFDSFGFIQVSKEMVARMEALRGQHGRRSYASMISTSYGIEDLASYGAQLVEESNNLSCALAAMAYRVLAVCEVIRQKLQKKPAIFCEVDWVEQSFLVEDMQQAENLLQAQLETFISV